METILKVLSEKIEALELNLSIANYQIDDLKAKNEELKKELETKEVKAND